MTTQNPVSASQASRELSDCYSATAAEYDRLWAPVIQPMGAHLVQRLPDALGTGSGTQILDLGTGPGTLLPRLARTMPGSNILAIDSAPGMLRRARSRFPDAALAAMDATALGLAADSMDLVVLAFVLFHLPDPVGALDEVARVLRPGGVLGVCTWGEGRALPGEGIWMAELGAAAAPADERPACVQQHALMDTPEKVERLLVGSGIQPEGIWSRRFERRWTPEELLVLGARYGWSYRRLRKLSEVQAERCCERVRPQLEALTQEELIFRPEVIYGIGRRLGGP